MRPCERLMLRALGAGYAVLAVAGFAVGWHYL